MSSVSAKGRCPVLQLFSSGVRSLQFLPVPALPEQSCFHLGCACGQDTCFPSTRGGLALEPAQPHSHVDSALYWLTQAGRCHGHSHPHLSSLALSQMLLSCSCGVSRRSARGLEASPHWNPGHCRWDTHSGLCSGAGDSGNPDTFRGVFCWE